MPYVFSMNRLVLAIALYCLLGYSTAQAQMINEVVVRGNLKVESDAIRTILGTQKGEALDPEVVAEDIRELHALGYFSDIRFYKEPILGGVRVVVEVKEKPAIVEIVYEGLEELSEEDFSDKLDAKLYTIVNEATITSDLRIIEKQYLEKGYFLAKATYKLEKTNNSEHEVILKYIVDEGGVVEVGDMFIEGNEYFSDDYLIGLFLSKPKTRSSTFAAPGSVFNEDFLKRDVGFTEYQYKDQGFQEVKVSEPDVQMDADREFVRISFEVEEGIQYNIGSIDILGDILYPKEDMKEWMLLKPGKLFRMSQFQKDIEMLMDKYGDKGYAFVYVNPKHRFDRDKKLAHLNYVIEKREKVYFGNMTVVGNDKTRDNVVRRELEVNESELYSGTRLTQSKKNIERLGFFEEVQLIRKRDLSDPSLLNYEFKVTEKPTGQLQAAVGFSPSSTAESSWFGQGRYNEDNQSGYGWKSNVTGKWNGGNNYQLELGLTDPRVNDSRWSLGGTAFWRNSVRAISEDVSTQTQQVGGSIQVGKRLFELVSGSITYSYRKTYTVSDEYLIPLFKDDGISSSLTFGLVRNDLDNYRDPTEGLKTGVSQKVVGGPVLQGDFQYFETRAYATGYVPLDITETYRTYFRLHLGVGALNTYGDKEIPFRVRYRQGGQDDLRGYKPMSLGPKFTMKRSPDGAVEEVTWGGTRELLLQLEYFFPLIPEANIKALFFTDLGRIYGDNEDIELKGFYRDVGFGFRWITPIAPFRFEWAFPLEQGEMGEMRFNFSLGF